MGWWQGLENSDYQCLCPEQQDLKPTEALNLCCFAPLSFRPGTWAGPGRSKAIFIFADLNERERTWTHRWTHPAEPWPLQAGRLDVVRGRE